MAVRSDVSIMLVDDTKHS